MQEKIIQYLKGANGYISGEEISRHLKISRAGIWKYMQELRNNGYEIEAVPHLGYRLVHAPDKLLTAEIQSNLNTKCLGKKIHYLESTTSTMDVAFQLGVEGAAEGTVVCAESQTKGKGRLGRHWTSPKQKGIYMSIILRPDLHPTDVAQLTLLSAVAVCEAMRKSTGIDAKIKWPNDILVQQKKIAGILTELSAEMDRVRFVAIGIGVNVNTSLSQLPTQATSVKVETGRKFSRIVLVQEILRTLEYWYGQLDTGGFSSIIARWKELSSTLGQNVRIADQGGEIVGKAIDLDEYGGLIIEDGNGTKIKRMTGDVIQVG